MRFSSDFTAAARGSTYYSAVMPEGVTVDGRPDDMPAAPVSSWWQLSTSLGTVVRVVDSSEVGGTQSNFYIDDLRLDLSDTGDRRHYGDNGVYFENPNLSFTYYHATYILPPDQPNVGETYAAYFAEPVVVRTFLRRGEGPQVENLYLPLVAQGEGP
jgi:hypothetical protein